MSYFLSMFLCNANYVYWYCLLSSNEVDILIYDCMLFTSFLLTSSKMTMPLKLHTSSELVSTHFRSTLSRTWNPHLILFVVGEYIHRCVYNFSSIIKPLTKYCLNSMYIVKKTRNNLNKIKAYRIMYWCRDLNNLKWNHSSKYHIIQNLTQQR